MNIKSENNLNLESEEQNEFEGPEKNLQVIFTKSTSSLLKISTCYWKKMLESINCTIISSKSNDKCNSFILSESSLFVFKDRIIVKTCGTIPLLLSIDEIIQIGLSIGLKVAAILYWRKNFLHQERQNFPHTSFSSEVQFLDSKFADFNPTKIRCGPISQDHWYFYYVELSNKNNFRPVFSTFELKMHEVHPETSKNFVINSCSENNFTVKKVKNIIQNASVDEFFFDPCGYSMNALFNDTEEYETVHITPENNCSYVSFEAYHDELLKDTRYFTNKILKIFHPVSLIGVEVSSSPFSSFKKQIDDYIEAFPLTRYELNGIYITFFSYVMKEKEIHPLAYVAEKRRIHHSKVSVLGEIGKYSGLEPPPESKYLLSGIDNQIIMI